jgi:hypothetical protein
MTELNVCGRAGLAKILDSSESHTRNLEKAGLIAPIAIIGGRPLFSTVQAWALKAQRDAKRRGQIEGAKAA